MNQRIRAFSDAEASPAATSVFRATEQALGMVPNLHRTLAHAPAALRAYHDTVRHLAGGVLPAPLRERIALTVAGRNGCGYCASAHTVLGSAAGLAAGELACNLRGESTDGASAVALTFVRELLEHRGAVDDAALARVREAGFGDAEIVEIVAHVGVNVFTNFLNNVAGTVIDFPVVEVPAAEVRR